MTNASLDIHKILEYLPHRYPFLMIDRVDEFVLDDELTGTKNVTANEPYFMGHFPDRPVMPGVMIMESLAQAAGILAFMTMDERGEQGQPSYYYAGIDNARFKKTVSPGDVLKLHAKKLKERRGIWKFHVEASVDGKLVAEADILCAVRES